VTFNYDVSLERRLVSSLNSIERYRHLAEQFFAPPRILHVYGSLRSIQDSTSSPHDIGTLQWDGSERDSTIGLLEAAYEAGKRIRTMAPDEKSYYQDDITIAKQCIEKATYVYILGYGFDRENSKLIGLAPLLTQTHGKKIIFYTNLSDSARVNKEAAAVFFHDRQAIQNEPQRMIRENVERSVRTVYDAFALDFDAPEGEGVG
jgi:hypothetical protein